MNRSVTEVDGEGLPHASRTKAIAQWRNVTNDFKLAKSEIGLAIPAKDQKIKVAKKSQCLICNGSNVKVSPSGLILCLCQMQLWANQLYGGINLYQSKYVRTTISDMRPWGSSENLQNLRTVISAAKNFVRNMDQWLVLSGSYGSGKSHILRAIATELSPFTLYISTDDLENHIFSAMDNNLLGELMGVLNSAPILLLDDLGNEHGAKFMVSKLRAIINGRYSNPLEYLTVIATNLSLNDLSRYDARLGSRLGDIEVVNFVEFGDKIGDYRKVQR